MFAVLRFLGTICLIVAAVFAVDRAIYDALIFAPAHRGGWESFFWYTFEYHARQLQSRRSENEGRPYILVVGSSISRYSVQQRQLERELRERHGLNARVEFFMHAAMVPTDLRYYAPRIRELRPDLVVYLTGPADLDLERYAAPYELSGAEDGYIDRSAERFMAHRHPLLLFYPAAYARDHYGSRYVDFERFLSLNGRGLFAALRFRDEWWDPVYFNLMRAGAAPLTRYLNYQGIPVPEGTWREGNSIGCFTFPMSAVRRAGELNLQVTKPLFAAGDFRIDFYDLGDFATAAAQHEHLSDFEDAWRPDWVHDRDNVELKSAALFPAKLPKCAPPAGEPVYTFTPKRAGWRSVPLPESLTEDRVIFARLNYVEDIRSGKAVRVDAPNDDRRPGRGVRLPGNFGLASLPVDQHFVRRPAWEDRRLSLMNADRYAEDFQARIHPADWEAPEHLAFLQLNRIRLAKYLTNFHGFSEIYEVRDLRKFVEGLSDDTRVLVVNNPENPLALLAYDDNGWYRGYQEYMREWAASSGGRVRFADVHRALPANRFLDTHHLSYDGMLEMTPVYAELMAGALR